MAELPKSIGWIGLGLMGLPMAKNLLQKTDISTQLYVYDVVQENMDKLVGEDKDRVHACGSSREVADKSVRQCHDDICIDPSRRGVCVD